MRLRPEQHLRRQADFRAVRESGKRIDCGAFTAWCLLRPESSGRSRVGIAASKASLGSSVPRNRARRRLREIFRLNQHRLPPGCDILLVARHSVNRLDYALLEQKFIETCLKLAGPTR